MTASLAPVVVVAAHKGGVGKTTTAANLAAELAELGLRVLAVDLDGQGHLGAMLGVPSEDREPGASAVVVETGTRAVPADAAIRHTERAGLDVLPGNEGLYDADVLLASRLAGREQVVARALAPLRARYDVVIVDTPPQRGLLTIAALVAATAVVPVVSAHHLSLEGVAGLTRTMALLAEATASPIPVLGYLLTMASDRSAGSRRVATQLREAFGPAVFASVIRRSDAVAEAPSYGRPVRDYLPRSIGTADYAALAREVADRLALPVSATATA